MMLKHDSRLLPLALLVTLSILSVVPSCGNAANRKASDDKGSKAAVNGGTEQVLVAGMTPTRPSAGGQPPSKTKSGVSDGGGTSASRSAKTSTASSSSGKASKTKKKKKKAAAKTAPKAAPSPVTDGVLVRLQPMDYNFGEQSVGVVRKITVEVVNLDTRTSLNLNSLSGSSSQFHTSPFVSKVVAARNSTTFDIGFLPRSIGPVELNLTVRTSHGDISYLVSGYGVESPYHLRPFIGVRVPINITYQPLISIHNPYSTVLQVIEMYTSTGGLHLELPSNKLKADQNSWEIGPYQTKTVMRVQYVGSTSHNFTGFIRLKMLNPDSSNETVVLPVEVEVTNATGLFCTLETLDFGTLRSMDEARNVSIALLNSGPSAVKLTSIVAKPSPPGLEIQFTPSLLKSRRRYSRVAHVALTASQCEKCGYIQGTVEVTATDGSGNVAMSLSIPYRARILEGTLQYTMSLTSFRVSGPPYYPVVHSFPLTNTFNETVVVLDARFPPEVMGLLSLNDFRPPIIIHPRQTITPFSVYFLSNSSDMMLTAVLRVTTNASVFAVPFQCYNGQLKVSIPGQHEATFAVELKAPLKEGRTECNITIKTPMQGVVASSPVRIRSLFRQDLTVLSVRPEVEDPRFRFQMAPGHIVLSDKKVMVGNIFFNGMLDKSMQQHRYVGVGAKGTTSRLVWLQNILKDTFQPDEDIQDYEVLRDKWAAIQEAGRSLTNPNMTFLLDTDVVENYRLSVQASLTWPSISQESTLQLPLTHVGRESVAELRVFNPSNTRLVIQLVMLHDYPEPQRILDVFSDRLDTDEIDLEGSRNSFFLTEAIPAPQIGPAYTVILVLQANESSMVKIGFKPSVEKAFTSMVLLKNNLTVLDAVQLTGEGIHGSLTVNGMPCNGASALVFAMSTSLAEQCTKKKADPLSLQRTVSVHNNGRLPLHVVGLFINDKDCDGYGFSVNNCRRFVLKPNTTRLLKIAFTPDFSMSRVQRTLRFNVKEIGWLTFNLVGTIPRELLPVCLSHLPRPWWEVPLRYFLCFFSVSMMLFVSFLAYSDASKFDSMAGALPPDLQPRFDLRNLQPHLSDSNDDDIPPPASSSTPLKYNTPSSSPSSVYAAADLRSAKAALPEPQVGRRVSAVGSAPASRWSPRLQNKGKANGQPHAPSKAETPSVLSPPTTPTTISNLLSKPAGHNSSSSDAISSVLLKSAGSQLESVPVSAAAHVPAAGLGTPCTSSTTASPSGSSAAGATSPASASSHTETMKRPPRAPSSLDLTSSSSASTPSATSASDNTTAACKRARAKKNGGRGTPSPTDSRSKLLKRGSSESLDSVDSVKSSRAQTNSPAAATPSTSPNKGVGKKTKAMLREEKREKQRQRDRERLQALQQNAAATGGNAGLATPDDAPATTTPTTTTSTQDNLDLLLSSVDRDGSVKPSKSGKLFLGHSKSATATPQPSVPAVDCALAMAMSTSHFRAAESNAERKQAAGETDSGVDMPRVRRSVDLVTASTSAKSSCLPLHASHLSDMTRPPSSPHEVASAIASRMGLTDEKGMGRPESSLATGNPPFSRLQSLGARTAPLEPAKPSPAGGKSSSEVFRRYLDNPSVQPEEFRPRNTLLATTSGNTPTSARRTQSSSTAWPSTPTATTASSSSSSSSSSSVSVSQQSSNSRSPAAASQAWPASLLPSRGQSQPSAIPTPPPAAARGTPPGLSRISDLQNLGSGLTVAGPAAGTALASVYSHASVEQLAVQGALARRAPTSPEKFSRDNMAAAATTPLDAPAAAAAAAAAVVRVSSSHGKSTMDGPAASGQLPPFGMDEWAPFSDRASDASSSPAWDSPMEAGTLDLFAASAQAYEQQRFEGARLAPSRSSSAGTRLSSASSGSSTAARGSGAGTLALTLPASGAPTPGNASTKPVAGVYDKYAYTSGDVVSPVNGLDAWPADVKKLPSLPGVDAMDGMPSLPWPQGGAPSFPLTALPPVYPSTVVDPTAAAGSFPLNMEADWKTADSSWDYDTMATAPRTASAAGASPADSDALLPAPMAGKSAAETTLPIRRTTARPAKPVDMTTTASATPGAASSSSAVGPGRKSRSTDAGAAATAKVVSPDATSSYGKMFSSLQSIWSNDSSAAQETAAAWETTSSLFQAPPAVSGTAAETPSDDNTDPAASVAKPFNNDPFFSGVWGEFWGNPR